MLVPPEVPLLRFSFFLYMFGSAEVREETLEFCFGQGRQLDAISADIKSGVLIFPYTGIYGALPGPLVLVVRSLMVVQTRWVVKCT